MSDEVKGNGGKGGRKENKNKQKKKLTPKAEEERFGVSEARRTTDLPAISRRGEANGTPRKETTTTTKALG